MFASPGGFSEHIMSFEQFRDLCWVEHGRQHSKPSTEVRENLDTQALKLYNIMLTQVADPKDIAKYVKEYRRIASGFKPALTRDEFNANCEVSRGNCEFTAENMNWGPMPVVCEGYDMGEVAFTIRLTQDRPLYRRVEGNTRKHPHEFNGGSFCCGPASQTAIKQALGFGKLDSARAIMERQVQFRERNGEQYTPAWFYACPACRTTVNEETEAHPNFPARPIQCPECNERTCTSCTAAQAPCRKCRQNKCGICKNKKIGDGWPCRCDATFALTLAMGAFAEWPGDEIFKNALATILTADVTPVDRWTATQGIITHWEQTYGKDIATLHARGVAALAATVPAF